MIFLTKNLIKMDKAILKHNMLFQDNGEPYICPFKTMGFTKVQSSGIVGGEQQIVPVPQPCGNCALLEIQKDKAVLNCSNNRVLELVSEKNKLTPA